MDSFSMGGILALRENMTASSTRSLQSGRKRIKGGQKRTHARPIAVFDIDGTIFRSSLAIELVERLIQKKVFPKTARRAYEKEYERWRDREGDYETYINKIVETLWGHLKGIPYKTVFRIADKLISEKHRRVYRYTRGLVKTLKKKGYFLLAVSHSPRLVVEGFTKTMGFDKAYGSLAETDAWGRFTGNPIDFHLIADKAGILKRVVVTAGLSLKGSVGVGDTESDIPFLSLVETPICFNPNMRLYRHALRRGWKIVVERKDVIYDAVRAKKP